MNPDLIYSALLSNAAQFASAVPPTSTTSLNLSPLRAQITASMLVDDKSERIFQALLAAANSPSPTLSPAKLVALAASSNSTSTTEVIYEGFLTSRFASLPSAASILIGVFLILLSIACLITGARSLFVGRDLGRIYGSDEKKGWLGGGAGGVFFGGVSLGLVVTSLTLLIVSRQDESSLAPWGTLAIIVLCALPGAIAGGRWSWVSKSSVAIVGSVSLSLLLIISFHISSILTRLVLSAILLSLSLLAANLRLSQRFALPAFSALSGSLLLVLGIDLFVHLGFIDALDLLIQRNGVGSGGGEAKDVAVDWASGGGKGLIACWWILSIASGVWQGWWGLGIQGEELWNNYLARYIPSASPLGTHLPPATIVDRMRSLFSSSPEKRGLNRHETLTEFSRRRTPWDDVDEDEDDEFDYEKGLVSPKVGLGKTASTRREGSDTWDSEVDTLASRKVKKPIRPPNIRSGSSKPAQYGQVSSDDDEDEAGMWTGGKGMDAKSTRSFGALSGSTAFTRRSSDYVGDKGIREEEEEECDLVEKDTRTKEFSSLPVLLNSDHPSSPPSSSTKRGSVFKQFFNRTSPSSSAKNPKFDPSQLPVPSSHSVPATPSLLNAIDRVNAAQREARTQQRGVVDEERAQMSEQRQLRGSRASMDEFWKSVIDKSEGR